MIFASTRYYSVSSLNGVSEAGSAKVGRRASPVAFLAIQLGDEDCTVLRGQQN